MSATFDVIVVGAGPAGSVAALVLARGGARVALVDKMAFPRDKACGDLVGPRGVQLLDDLGVSVPEAIRVGDMAVVGPTHSVRLPCRDGLEYPDHGLALPRHEFDRVLHDTAVDAGAVPFSARAAQPVAGPDGLGGFCLSTGETLRADVIVGADGATSHVAGTAGLVDVRRVLWGFAVRTYVDAPIEVPQIFLWESAPRRAFPGYGWAFPGPDGRANVGLGCGVLADRSAGALATRCWAPFMEELTRRGVLEAPPGADGGLLGGWLKLGMVGTNPAAGPVLLVGDAAGLVNPLQGEGISQAMGSGRAAAEAVLAGPGDAAARYRRYLSARDRPYQSVTAPLHAALLPRPVVVSMVARAVTAPVIGRLLAGGWSIFWNDLLDGAAPGSPRVVARAATAAARTLTAAGRTRRWFRATFAPDAAGERGRRDPGRRVRTAS
ncbi:MAG TPA: NAD(P)/FAD-dependent oxidoreductase [Acidimicrobiia bacterium]|nr:NAD(P)/FAD-dependent oxidoreductase [Acidimicrobiia bacterium]